MIHEEVSDPTINFSWFKFIGRKKLALTNQEVGRLTLREFNREYQLYKDDFDMELCLKLSHTTYAKAKEQQYKAEDWGL